MVSQLSVHAVHTHVYILREKIHKRPVHNPTSSRKNGTSKVEKDTVGKVVVELLIDAEKPMNRFTDMHDENNTRTHSLYTWNTVKRKKSNGESEIRSYTPNRMRANPTGKPLYLT